MEYFSTFFLDKEADIRVDLYRGENHATLSYVVSTPFVSTGNLISNLAMITKTKVSFNRDGKKVIKGKIPCYLTSHSDEIYIFRLNGMKIANIYGDGRIEKRALIPAISKVLMSQAKDYHLPLNKTILKTYLPYECKFKTDLHTHMNANLYPSTLVALGIYKQIRYPYYYIKKLHLKITPAQKTQLEKDRREVEKQFAERSLNEKKRNRAIDDRTFINFADLILNNPKDANYNLNQIRNSLTILKDGQAVFTNLEKLYLYRYVFTKGTISDRRIEIGDISSIPHADVRKRLTQMLLDAKDEVFKDNTLFEDELLWIGRQYQKQSISYVEIADTNLVKSAQAAAEELRQIHHIMPYVRERTGVSIRFLGALRRIPLTLVKTDTTSANYLLEALDVLKSVAKDPYVAGCDIVGEEINDIQELKPVIEQLVSIAKDDPYFTIRIHAGENDSIMDNVYNSIILVKDALAPGQKMPILRIGHGLCTPSLNCKAGRELVQLIKDTCTTLEFQMTSNVRLNNLSDITKHPFRKYLSKGIRCVQGTDGCGIYGTDSTDEQLALIALLGLNETEMKKIIRTEKEIIAFAQKAFKEKTKTFERLQDGRSIVQTIVEETEKNRTRNNVLPMVFSNLLNTEEVLKDRISALPEDKIPIILCGGSFNSSGRPTRMKTSSKKFIESLLKESDPQKYFFVIGHQLQGYEKYLADHHRNFDIFAIVPSGIDEETYKRLAESKVKIRVSTQLLGMGIYKSFNYEIFERRPSIVIMMDGNSAGANLLQEARNGKAHADIYVSCESAYLAKKAEALKGYVRIFNPETDSIIF